MFNPPCTPTPPATRRAPVNTLVETVVEYICIPVFVISENGILFNGLPSKGIPFLPDSNKKASRLSAPWNIVFWGLVYIPSKYCISPAFPDESYQQDLIPPSIEGVIFRCEILLIDCPLSYITTLFWLWIFPITVRSLAIYSPPSVIIEPTTGVTLGSTVLVVLVIWIGTDGSKPPEGLIEPPTFKLPAILTPPDITTEPVPTAVDPVVFVTDRIPAISQPLFNLVFFIIFIPPSQMREPELVPVLSVLLLICNIPLIFSLPPILTLLAIPTPPEITTDPISVSTESVVFKDFTIPPICASLAIFIPPEHNRAPVSVPLTGVPLVINNTPLTVSFPPILTSSVIPTPPATVKAPVPIDTELVVFVSGKGCVKSKPVICPPYRVPPIYTSLAIPTPPETVKAPVLVDIVLVVPVIDNESTLWPEKCILLHAKSPSIKAFPWTNKTSSTSGAP